MPKPGGIQGQAQRPGVVAVAVGQHHDLVADATGLAPGLHHEHVVDRQAGDGVNALGAELVGQFHEPGQVARITGRREGAGHRKQHHLAAIEQLRGGEILQPVGCRDLEFAGRNFVAYSEWS